MFGTNLISSLSKAVAGSNFNYFTPQGWTWKELMDYLDINTGYIADQRNTYRHKINKIYQMVNLYKLCSLQHINKHICSLENCIAFAENAFDK